MLVSKSSVTKLLTVRMWARHSVAVELASAQALKTRRERFLDQLP